MTTNPQPTDPLRELDKVRLVSLQTASHMLLTSKATILANVPTVHWIGKKPLVAVDDLKAFIDRHKRTPSRARVIRP